MNAQIISCTPEMLELIKKHSKNLKYIFDNFEDVLPYKEVFVKMVNDSDELIKKATTI